ncbi:rhomboid family intramembrane serine protease [Actinobacteria bacterium YIM 96077]|uniref:Rhomboid family intramembrane serine protease n=1 Tax=Phytoactinopolyspora halophila TaxID=1981511 RepID=A0A329QQL7_9ACTN|nr:rhomboid family intramembrane serine protease [Phytoactinopolyspora halophila]AYY11376.1 rhomboid family intramembrane serine protease [Actinobacteria bacterium YIM 96077]RAW14675.1 rhomboid family intramembrane serine protease [Phytoactinopolyspora halophila]
MSSNPDSTSVPTCYRHADRETYVRCSRCERHICPDCMTTAPVGFQCPECIQQGNKSVRQARTVLGGKVREHGDLITKTLIGINVAIWLLVLVVQTGPVSDQMRMVYGASWDEIPARFALVLGYSPDPVSIGVVDGELYRLLTAAFIHQQVWHIGMNMLALFILGKALEPVLGRWRFITLYLLSALGGSAASLLAAGPYTMSLGASGAVFGLLGALFVVMRQFGRDVSAVVVILALNVVIGFTVPGIDWRAHLGGLVVGALLALVFARAPRRHRAVWGVAGSVVVALGIAGTLLLTLA